jgi:hypothetical protein
MSERQARIMATVIVELPTASYEQLTQRAAASGKSPEALSREILEAALGANGARPAGGVETPAPDPPAVPSDGGPPSLREILQAEGLLSELSPELRSLIIPGVTLEQVHEIFKDTGGPSLSDIIIEQRGPKD